MYSLKGFVEFAGFAINTPGQVAKIGELSSIARTYAKEKGIYQDAVNKDIEITSFLSQIDEVNSEMPVGIKADVFAIVNWIYGQMIAATNTQDRAVLIAALANTFQDKIEQIDCGSIVTDGSNYIPDWISWKFIGQESYVRLWFADDSFRTQYDEFEIVVIPALANLDQFFLTADEVKVRLEAMTTSKMVDRMQQAKNDYPETIFKVETFNYIAPGNPDYKVPSRWGVLIYGIAGDNIDAIKNALTEYILAHSTHSRDEWVEILPDLFKRTELIFCPLWNQYGIPNRRLESGIYSPLIKLAPTIWITKQAATGYPEPHVENYITFMGHPYKSLALSVIGGPENREGKFYFTDFYSDYISVSTSSVDFNRMSPETQEIATMLADMIYQAESMGKYTVLPFGMSRLIRNGILYVVKTMNNIQFLVVAKSNFESGNITDQQQMY